MIQVLTGHGCFGEYLYRIRRERTTRCHHCAIGQDSAQHTLEVCPVWGGGVEAEEPGPRSHCQVNASYAWEREGLESGLLLLSVNNAAEGSGRKEEREDLFSKRYSERKENEQCLLFSLQLYSRCVL